MTLLLSIGSGLWLLACDESFGALDESAGFFLRDRLRFRFAG